MFLKIFCFLLILAIIDCDEAPNVSLDESQVTPDPENPENSAEQIVNPPNTTDSFEPNESSSNETLVVQNITEEPVNVTQQRFVQCLPKLGSAFVQIVNDTELIKLLAPDPNVTSRDTPGTCVLVLFYSKYCPFSSLAAPHFNALARGFPDVKLVAINAMIYHLFNTQNGIVGVPSLMLFHSGRPVAKFNESEYNLSLFSKFVTKHTGIASHELTFVMSVDFMGPVTSVPSKDSDIFLVVAWLFIVLCAGYYFTQSKWCTWIVETIQRNWRESVAHAQHEHAE